MTHPRALLVACTCVVLAASAIGAGPAPSTQPSTDVQKENAELRKRVAALEARVKSLEQQLARAKAEGRLRIRPGPNIVPRFEPNVVPPYEGGRSQAPGRDWIPKEFNGRTYYIVPCDPEVASAAPPMISGSDASTTVAAPAAPAVAPTATPVPPPPAP